MNGKLVETSMGCVGVETDETVVPFLQQYCNIEETLLSTKRNEKD